MLYESSDFSRMQIFYEAPACPICLEEMTGSISSLACGHCFHRKCIESHLAISSNCPYCREEVEEKDLRWIYLELDFLREQQSRSVKTVSRKLEMEKLEEKLKEANVMIDALYRYQDEVDKENQRLNLLVEGLRKDKSRLEGEAKGR
jgi:hypothetical protein